MNPQINQFNNMSQNPNMKQNPIMNQNPNIENQNILQQKNMQNIMNPTNMNPSLQNQMPKGLPPVAIEIQTIFKISDYNDRMDALGEKLYFFIHSQITTNNLNKGL